MSGHTPWRDIKHKQELNVGSGKKCSSCGGTVAAGRKTCQNCGHSFASLGERVEAVEQAVVALGTQAFGDSAGHDFHGNQWTSGASGEGVRSPEKEREARRERIKNMTPEEKAAIRSNTILPGDKPTKVVKEKGPTDAQIYGRAKSVDQHMRTIEKRVDEAVKDTNASYPDSEHRITGDHIYHDVVDSYLHTEVRPSDRAAVARAAGVDRRPNSVW